MNLFDQIYTKLFKTEKNANQPLVVDGIIKRNADFVRNYQEWKVSSNCKSMLDDVSKSYALKKEGMDNDPEMAIHAGTNSNGFAIHFGSRFDKTSFHFFFDYLAEKVKQLDYKVSISKQTLKEKDDEVEKKEMHYLKPKNKFEKPIDQKYGNVQIEYLEVNNEPSRIKFIVNSYPDRNYTEALSFQSLTENIFEFEHNT